MNRKLIVLVVAVVAMVLVSVAPAAAQSSSNYVSYIVQRGDTLGKIAARYCTTWPAIYNINQQTIGTNPNRIEVGMVLTVPFLCGGTPPSQPGLDRGPTTYASGYVEGGKYVASWGDTQFSIARRFGISVEQIVDSNDFLETQGLKAGQRLTIPGLIAQAPTQLPDRAPVAPAAPSMAFRVFAINECSVQLPFATNMWQAPDGQVIGTAQPSTYPAVQVAKINSLLWYQVEAMDAQFWLFGSGLNYVGNCGL